MFIYKCLFLYFYFQPLDAPIRPTVRLALPDLLCTLDKTPFLDNLRKILDKSPKRPPTIYNEQRHLVCTSSLLSLTNIKSLSFFFLTNTICFSSSANHEIHSTLGCYRVFTNDIIICCFAL